jgi:hypothetical protein
MATLVNLPMFNLATMSDIRLFAARFPTDLMWALGRGQSAESGLFDRWRM